MPKTIQVNLTSLKELCEKCTACELGKTRTNMVYGRGNKHPDILFVGEAPGKNEDLQGEPFVGAAGKTLDALLTRCGINPANIYIANVLKCRPPNNRNPKVEEIAKCSKYLDAQIELLNPAIIVCLGAFATSHIMDYNGPMYQIRGQLKKSKYGAYVMSTYHPAAAIYDKTKMPYIEEDLRVCAELANRLRHNRP